MKRALIFKKLLRLGLLAVVLAASDEVAAQANESVRPNVIVILSDDQGWGILAFMEIAISALLPLIRWPARALDSKGFTLVRFARLRARSF